MLSPHTVLGASILLKSPYDKKLFEFIICFHQSFCACFKRFSCNIPNSKSTEK